MAENKDADQEQDRLNDLLVCRVLGWAGKICQNGCDGFCVDGLTVRPGAKEVPILMLVFIP